MTKKNIDIEKKKKSLWKRMLSWLIILMISALLIVSAFITFLAYNKDFRTAVISQILTIVNTQLTAKIEIGDIHLIGFGGIKLDDVKMITSGDTLAVVDEIIADISIEPLLRNKIQVNKLILNSPRIMMLRRKSDSSWNYMRIAPPSPTTDTTGPSDLSISLKNFEIRDGLFYMIDSLSSQLPTGKFDAANMKFDNLNVKLNADANLLNNEFAANIKNIALVDRTTKIDLKHFAGNVSLSKNGIKLEKTVIQSDGWNAGANISMTKFNVFGTEKEMDLNNTVFDIEFDVDKFNPSFTKHFADIPIEIGGVHKVSLVAKGTLNDLKISKMNLAFANSSIIASGLLSDVMKNDVKYAMSFDDSMIASADISIALPFINQETLPMFQKAEFKKLYVDGDTRKVFTDFDFSSDIGDAVGKADLDFENTLKYKAQVSTENLDLSKITHNKTLTSKLNAYADVSGSGSNLADLDVKLKIHSTESNFAGYSYQNLTLQASYKAKDSLIIDTLQLVLSNPDTDTHSSVFNKINSTINITGFADIHNMDEPIYDFNAKFSAVNLKLLLKNNDLPNYFTANIKFEGEGIDLDQMNAKLQANFEDMLFADKAMMPFEIAASTEIFSDSSRSIEFQSEFINFKLLGRFKTSELIESVVNQGLYISNFINDKINLLFLKSTTDSISTQEELKLASFPEIDCELTADIKNISPVLIFLKDFDASLNLKTHITIQSSAKESYFIIDSLNVETLRFKNKAADLKIKSMEMSAVLSLAIVDSLPKFSYIDLSANSTNRLIFNDITIDKPTNSFSFDGDIIEFNSSATVNNMFNYGTKGTLDISQKEVQLVIDTLALNYQDKYAWYNSSPLEFELIDNRISVKSFNLSRENAETVSITGTIDDNVAKDLQISLKSFPLGDLIDLLPDERSYKELKTLEGSLKNIDISVNGPLLSPIIDCQMGIEGISINHSPVGNFNLQANYADDNLSGFANIIRPNKDSVSIISDSSAKLLDIKINSVPIYIGTDTTKTLFSKTREMDITVIADRLPLQIIGPFVPNVSNMQGQGFAELKITGILPDYNYTGFVKIKNASLLLDNTNINYIADGELTIEKDKITIERLKLKNTTSDLRDGEADVTGFITLKDFQPDKLDFTIKADRFLVLSDASSVALPSLYGPFVIGTEDKSIRFYGTLDAPNLEGNVVVWNAELKMPQIINQQVIKTTFNYEVSGKSKIMKFKSFKDTTNFQVPEKMQEDKRDIADLINYDLDIKIKNFTILIDMGSIGEIYAKIGTRDPSIPMRYVKYRNSPAPKLYSGELELKEGSTLKIFRIMETTGIISFPTGSIDNPNLDLQAKYEGTIIDGSSSSNYTVFVYITGTKNTPFMKLDYTLNGETPSGGSEKIQEDAFTLLATGNTKSGLGGGGSSNLVGQGLNMGISQLASKSLTDLLLGTGMIQSADISFQGEGLQNAKVNLSGSLQGIGNWTVGGNIADLSSNYELTLEIPISLKSKALSNFILQISKSANLNISTQIQDAKDFELKIKVGGSW